MAHGRTKVTCPNASRLMCQEKGHYLLFWDVIKDVCSFSSEKVNTNANHEYDLNINHGLSSIAEVKQKDWLLSQGQSRDLPFSMLGPPVFAVFLQYS